ncbi:hypothetical protein V493_07365 [Pseudogymnoascus sp. VKM F-4281 (FW-2241)]|nr:hypothetical protein V493_07365 [Pseudogymnoascus sp. VKM F-4281 (FW-2241)]
MKLISSQNSLILAFGAILAAVEAAPKLLICSDSTTANYESGALQGWGYYIGDYLSITVSNQARNGRSTRSFINEGLWDNLLSDTTEGDLVVIEMGHNDDVDLGTDTADRGTLPGIGDDSVTVITSTGESEVVYSFGWYLRKMIKDVQDVGGIPLISGMVNRNYWDGNTLQNEWLFATYAEEVATQASVEYIDHTKYSVNKWQSMGPTTAKTYFPNDNTHTSPEGAVVNAETFVEAIKCVSATSQLLDYLNSKGTAGSAGC